jgi:hypothetical protein
MDESKDIACTEGNKWIKHLDNLKGIPGEFITASAVTIAIISHLIGSCQAEFSPNKSTRGTEASPNRFSSKIAAHSPSSY